MASSAGKFALQMLSDASALFPQHNPETSAPGLPVKAAHLICQGVMVAYDPANSQAQCADPAMAATAKVIGFNTGDSVDNLLGAKGDLKIKPQAGIGRVKNDGNLTAAHLYTRVRVIDDHTVGIPAGTDADRIAGLLIGLDGDYVWIIVAPAVAARGPITVTLQSTNNTAGAAADLAALKAECEKGFDDLRAIHAALVLHNIIAPAA